MASNLPTHIEQPTVDLHKEVVDVTKFSLATLAASIVIPSAAILIPAAYGVKKMAQALES